MAVQQHYKILAVPEGASSADVRAAYRKLAKEFHPDRFTTPDEKRRAEATFTQMTEAFNVLTDTEKRKAWEQEVRLAASSESLGLLTEPSEGTARD